MTWLLFIWLCSNFLIKQKKIVHQHYAHTIRSSSIRLVPGKWCEQRLWYTEGTSWRISGNTGILALVETSSQYISLRFCGGFLHVLPFPPARLRHSLWGDNPGKVIQHHRTAQGGISGDNKHLSPITGRFVQWLSGERSWFKSFTESMNLYCADMLHEISQNQVCLIYVKSFILPTLTESRTIPKINSTLREYSAFDNNSEIG